MSGVVVARSERLGARGMRKGGGIAEVEAYILSVPVGMTIPDTPPVYALGRRPAQTLTMVGLLINRKDVIHEKR
jgi:hypothetical protein